MQDLFNILQPGAWGTIDITRMILMGRKASIEIESAYTLVVHQIAVILSIFQVGWVWSRQPKQAYYAWLSTSSWCKYFHFLLVRKTHCGPKPWPTSKNPSRLYVGGKNFSSVTLLKEARTSWICSNHQITYYFADQKALSLKTWSSK